MREMYATKAIDLRVYTQNGDNGGSVPALRSQARARTRHTRHKKGRRCAATAGTNSRDAAAVAAHGIGIDDLYTETHAHTEHAEGVEERFIRSARMGLMCDPSPRRPVMGRRKVSRL